MISTAPLRVRLNTSHRHSEFIYKIKVVREKILEFIGPGWELAIFPCSGTGAIQAMMQGIKHNSSCVVLSNGTYGDRLGHIAMHSRFQSSWCGYSYLSSVPEEREGVIAMVHGETSTGKLNNLDQVLDFASKYGKYVVVDAVASFLMDKLDFTHTSLGAVAFSSCKGLRGLPGTGFVAYRPDILGGRSSFYFALSPNSHDTPTCTPVSEVIEKLFYDLFHSHFLETWSNRYPNQKAILRKELELLGFEFVTPKTEEMNCLSVVQFRTKEERESCIRELDTKGIELYKGEGNTVKISILNLFEDTDCRKLDLVIDALKKWQEQ